VTDCLAKNADQRPASMSDVLWRLRHLDEEVAPLNQPPPRRWMVPVLALVVVATLVGAGALLASGPVEAVVPVEAPPVLPTPKPVVILPPAEAPRPPPVVSIAIESIPAGATVIDGEGTTLGVTPLTVKRDQGTPALKVRLELKGYESVTREFETTESLHAELPLKRLALPVSKKQSKVVKDGVLDPF
jgi:hypothetical protein